MVIAASLMDHLDCNNLSAPALIEPGCDLDFVAHLTTDSFVEVDRRLRRSQHGQPCEDTQREGNGCIGVILRRQGAWIVFGKARALELGLGDAVDTTRLVRSLTMVSGQELSDGPGPLPLRPASPRPSSTFRHRSGIWWAPRRD